MIIDKNILNCELEYAQCFSDHYDHNNVIRFRDNEIKDMYDHNFTYVKEEVSDIELIRIVEEEISFRLYEKSDYCKVSCYFHVDSSIMDKFKYKGELSTLGMYSYDISKLSKLKTISDAEIKRVENEEMVDDILYCDLQHNELRLGREFCTRRSYKRGKAYVSDKRVNSYVCYHNGEIIGKCDLLIFNGAAKIEDFAVIPAHQHKGYGTTILKNLINIALGENCHTIYLNTDEDDTPKYMYQKLGFNKIGESMNLLFKL